MKYNLVFSNNLYIRLLNLFLYTILIVSAVYFSAKRDDNYEFTYVPTGTTPQDILISNLNSRIVIFIYFFIFLISTSIVYTYHRIFLPKTLSILGTLLVMTASQVLRVFQSALFWDFFSKIIFIFAIISVICILGTKNTFKNTFLRINLFFVKLIIALALILVSWLVYEYISFQYSILDVINTRIIIYVIILFIFILFSLLQYVELNKLKSHKNNYRQDVLIFYFFTYLTVFLVYSEYIFGRGNSSGLLYFGLIFSIIPYFTKLKINSWSRIYASATILLSTLIGLLSGTTGRDRLFVYFIGGRQNSELIFKDGNHPAMRLPIHFSDAEISQFSSQVAPVNLVDFYQSFFSHSFIDFYQSIKIFFYGLLGNIVYSEPFYDQGFFHILSTARYTLLSNLIFISALALIFSLLYIYKNDRVLFFIIILLNILLLSQFILSRIYFHQWWFLFIIGSPLVILGFSKFFLTLFSLLLNFYNHIFTYLKSKKILAYMIALTTSILITFSGNFFIEKTILFINNYIDPYIKSQLATIDQIDNKFYEKVEFGEIVLPRKIEQDLNYEIYDIPASISYVRLISEESCDLSFVNLVLKRTNELGIMHRFNIGKEKAKILEIPLYPYTNKSSELQLISGTECNYFITTSNDPIMYKNRYWATVYSEKETINASSPNKLEENLTSELLLYSNFSFQGYKNIWASKTVDKYIQSDAFLNDYSAKILGTTALSRRVTEILHLKQEMNQADKYRSVTFRGSLERGSIVVGWYVPIGERGGQDGPILSQYQIMGSGFYTINTELDSCVDLPKIMPKTIVFFVASIDDLYQFSYHDTQINSIKLESESCGENKNTLNLLGTL